MSNSTKTQEDLALVQEIIGVDPLDFARWASGELVIILPDGRKLLLTPDQVTRALASGEYRLNAAPARGRGRPRKETAS
ncbi:MAG: hypothetical protein AB2L18_09370 [Anaerolineaceae bacterium]